MLKNYFVPLVFIHNITYEYHYKWVEFTVRDQNKVYSVNYFGFVSMSDTCLMMMFSLKLFSF